MLNHLGVPKTRALEQRAPRLQARLLGFVLAARRIPGSEARIIDGMAPVAHRLFRRLAFELHSQCGRGGADRIDRHGGFDYHRSRKIRLSVPLQFGILELGPGSLHGVGGVGGSWAPAELAYCNIDNEIMEVVEVLARVREFGLPVPLCSERRRMEAQRHIT